MKQKLMKDHYLTIYKDTKGCFESWYKNYYIAITDQPNDSRIDKRLMIMKGSQLKYYNPSIFHTKDFPISCTNDEIVNYAIRVIKLYR